MRAKNFLQQGLLLFCGFGIATAHAFPAQGPQHAQELLHLFYLASGGSNWTPLAQANISGMIDLGGIKGNFYQIVDMKNGRDVTDTHAGPFQTKQGNLPDSSWQMNRNGVVSYSDTPSDRVDAINQSFVDRNGWFTAPASELTYDGMRQDHHTRYDLITITPAGGRSMTLWLNAQNHLLYRIDQLDADHDKNDTYLSDYRRVDGVLVPFHIRQSDGDRSQDTVAVIQSMRFSSTIDQTAFLTPPSTFRFAHLLGKQSSVTVPFTLANAWIIVNLSINGHAPLPFILDTGGSNYITPTAAGLFGLKEMGNAPLDGVGKRQSSIRFAKVSELRLGAVEMSHQLFAVGPLPSFLQGVAGKTPLAGLVGAQLLHCFPTTFNYQKRTLTFYRPGMFPSVPPTAQTLKLYFNGGHPFLEVAVDGVAGIFGIDTGDDGSTTIFAPFYRAHRFPVTQPTLSESQGGFGGMEGVQETRIGSLGFGAWKLKDSLVTLNFTQSGVFSNNTIAGNLGSQLLQNFVFTLDYEHQKGYFVRSSKFGIPIAYNRSGMRLHRAPNGKVLVLSVGPNTPAQKAGIQVGDTILSLNGKNPEHIIPAELDDLFSKEAGTLIDVRYWRNGKEGNAVFRLKELLPRNAVMRPLDLKPMGK